MTIVNVNCTYCGKKVEKLLGEYNRRIKLGKTEFFCDNTCGSKMPEFVERMKSFAGLNNKHLRHYPRDEFTDFRWYMKMMKYPNRCRNRPHTIDFGLEYLKEIWELQDGICPLSGIKMVLRTHTNCSKSLMAPYSASIDRIDNSIGYVKGNIRFVCHMANIARNRYSDEEVIEFCKSVALYHSVVKE